MKNKQPGPLLRQGPLRLDAAGHRDAPLERGARRGCASSGVAPRLAATRSAYTRAEAARPATVQPASAYPGGLHAPRRPRPSRAPLRSRPFSRRSPAWRCSLASRTGTSPFGAASPSRSTARKSGRASIRPSRRPQGQQLLRRQARPPALGWRQRAQGGRRRALLRHAGKR